MSTHDTDDTYTINCPHCGYKKDPSECGMSDGDQEELECGKCEKSFVVTCSVSRTFSTETK